MDGGGEGKKEGEGVGEGEKEGVEYSHHSRFLSHTGHCGLEEREEGRRRI